MKTQSKKGIGAIMIAALLFALAFRSSEPCNINGIVTEKGATDGLVGTMVSLSQNGKLVQTTLSDANGRFCFTHIADGNYEIIASNVGYMSAMLKVIFVKDGKTTEIKIELQPSSKDLNAVEIIQYKVPLIDRSNTSSKNIVTAEEIAIMPTRNITDVASTTAGAYQVDDGSRSLVKGGRSEATEYHIDGVKVQGVSSSVSRSQKAPQRMLMMEAENFAVMPAATPLDWENDPRTSGKEDKTKPDNTDFNTEGYDHIVENEFEKPENKPLSTFSIDVDVASYGILRKKLAANQTPPKTSVRIEELINYFTYDYAEPTDGKPFTVATEVGECPWNLKHSLVQVGIQGKRIDKKSLPPSNLVFLIDVSGSMESPDKLPLVKESLRMLVKELNEKDKIAMTVYAGNAGLVLPSTSCNQKEKIIEAIDRLEAGGSTAGAAGINLAYKVAKENFLNGGNNRVILCTDGDFNVGVSSDAELTALIEKKREEGVFLSVLGFGTGNYQDAKMENLADKGNGNYAYIDNIQEAKKNLVTQMGGTLLAIAKDVKIQVEFNPSQVKAYRLIGYENRALADRDFNDDKKDAGEIGAGVSVTALYELITDPDDSALKATSAVDPLKYQKPANMATANSDEMLNVKIRYKEPKENTSKLLQFPVKESKLALANTSNNFRFAAAVASFGLVLRDSKFKGNFTFDKVKLLANAAKGKDAEGYRSEFIQMVDEAHKLDRVQR